MFTGIIEELGIIGGWPGQNLLRVNCKLINHDFHPGDSIAVNGVCLTINAFDNQGFTADVSTETQKRWCRENYRNGCHVNLERALAVNGRLGGHFVQGHVDGVGHINQINPCGDFIELCVELHNNLENYVVEKGSIAIDGISLTVNRIEKNQLSLMIIPHTFKNTVLAFRNPGSGCNIEVDILAKYVARLLKNENQKDEAKHGPDMEFFLRSGFGTN